MIEHTDQAGPQAPRAPRAPTAAQAMAPRVLEYIRARCWEDDDGCWIWLRAVTRSGYPSTGAPWMPSRYPHVAAWIAAHGRAPGAGRVVRRTCGKLLCCRPECGRSTPHRDMIWLANAERGAYLMTADRRAAIAATCRRRRGKLTPAGVRAILTEDTSAREMAARLSVSTSTVYQVRAGKSWVGAVQIGGMAVVGLMRGRKRADGCVG